MNLNNVAEEDMDVAVLFHEKFVALIVEFCVDCDTKKFHKGHWKTLKGLVETAAKVRNSRSLIEG